MRMQQKKIQHQSNKYTHTQKDAQKKEINVAGMI